MANKKLKSKLIVLPLKEFDVIVGMNWLSKYQAHIDCSKKPVSLCVDGDVFYFLDSRSALSSLVSVLQVVKA